MWVAGRPQILQASSPTSTGAPLRFKVNSKGLPKHFVFLGHLDADTIHRVADEV